MNKGKVVIIAGNKRTGKTTLTNLLHDKYNFNYYNYDMLLDSIEAAFPDLADKNDDKYIELLNNMVERSLEDANNYGISTVYEYIFTPKQLSTFKYKDSVEIYVLANLDITEDNIVSDMKEYSKPFDWPSYVSQADIDRNVKEIMNKNELLLKDCKKYGFELINTSRGDKRDSILNELAERISKKID